MPELPEVEALSVFLAERCSGTQIVRAELGALSALKTFDPPLDSLIGRTVAGVGRRGKYLTWDLDGLWLVLHLARGGWVQWRDKTPAAPARPGRGPLALRVGLSVGSGFDVTEQGTEKRLALWVVRDPSEVEGVARLGPDPLAPGFSADDLAALLKGRSANVKTVLTDQSVIAGVGNAYSDEALHCSATLALQGRVEVERRGDGEASRSARRDTRSGAGEVRRPSGGRPQVREEERHGGPRTHRLAMPRLRRHGPGGLVRHQVPPILPDLPDRRQDPGGPPPVASAEVTEPSTGGTQLVHRGVHWYRDQTGAISFYNTDSEEWVQWRRGADAPPLPPDWTGSSLPGRVTWPKWTSPWRIIPMIGAVIVVVLAVWQVTSTSGGQESKETAATAALLGKCLAQHGSLEGHPRYSDTSGGVRFVGRFGQGRRGASHDPGQPVCAQPGPPDSRSPTPGSATPTSFASRTCTSGLTPHPGGARQACSASLEPHCGRGSAGRASPCQGEGRGFESRRPLQESPGQTYFLGRPKIFGEGAWRLANIFANMAGRMRGSERHPSGACRLVIAAELDPATGYSEGYWGRNR